VSDWTLALAYVIEHEWDVVRTLSIDDCTGYLDAIADTFAFVIWRELWLALPDLALRPDRYIGDLI